MAASHTATTTYVDSVWPIVGPEKLKADLVWPDYGGEQIRAMASKRRVPAQWRSRVAGAPAWLLLVRLNQIRTTHDIFSRPLRDLKVLRTEEPTGDAGDHEPAGLSDQARLIELLQMLVYIREAGRAEPLRSPHLTVLLSCWDELSVDGCPQDILRERLPMLSDFIASTWAEPSVMGLSALGKPLSHIAPDMEYVSRGPEQFGFVVLPDGTQSSDLTLPISHLVAVST